MLGQMELHTLQVFLAVATEKSFSRAADRLLRTQPAVSLALQRLETELGEKLIDRSAKDLVLTDAGRTVLDYARRHKIAVVAYCPLGRGRLVDHPVLTRIGRKHGKSAAQVALRWLIEQPGVAAIPKSASERNLRANFEIFDFALDAEDQAAIAGLRAKERIVDMGIGPAWD